MVRCARVHAATMYLGPVVALFRTYTRPLAVCLLTIGHVGMQIGHRIVTCKSLYLREGPER